jgi:hypothetical protein
MNANYLETIWLDWRPGDHLELCVTVRADGCFRTDLLTAVIAGRSDSESQGEPNGAKQYTEKHPKTSATATLSCYHSSAYAE